MVTTQLDLDFAARERQVSEADIDTLARALRGSGWLTAAELCAALVWSDRKLRAVANADAMFVSFPGSPGYKLLAECTVEEFARVEAATLSQIRKMTERLTRMRAAYHRRGA